MSPRGEFRPPRRADTLRAAALVGALASMRCTDDHDVDICAGRCRPCPQPSACVEIDHASNKCECQLPDERALVEPNVLSSRLRVPPFPLARVAGERAAVFAWVAPPDTRIVHCAVFHCWPLVDTESDRRSIVNYDRCVLLSASFQPPEGRFDLGAYESVNSRNASWSPLNTFGPFVACWAYNATQLTSASNLLRLRLDELPGGGSLLPSCESGSPVCATAGGRFGVCASNGNCVQRCMLSSDCDVNATARNGIMLNDAGLAPSAQRQCVIAVGHVGLCAVFPTVAP